MNKREFLARLEQGLSCLPPKDIEERLSFFEEMIDDCVEEGMSEEEAVARVGSVDEIVSQTVAEAPLSKLVKERARSTRKLRAWEIVLLAIGSPVWVPLSLAALVVIFALYISVWAVVLAVWAVSLSVAVCAPVAMGLGIVYIVQSSPIVGLCSISCGLVLAGLAIFAFFGCRALGRVLWGLTRCTLVWIKNCFIRKEKKA